MRIESRAVAVCAAVCLQTGIASAQQRTVTLAEVLTLAREQAPQIVSARLAQEETRGRLVGASLRFQANPEVEAGLGSRQAASDRLIDFEVGLGQTFEPRSRRSARMSGANAVMAQSAAGVDETTRIVLRAAATAYYRALHARERIRLLTATGQIAADLYSVADRRFKAGDMAVLSVNIARASLARVRAELEAAEATKALVVGELKQLLRIEEDVVVEGRLAGTGEADLSVALQAASQRPEIRALEAGVQEAEAELRLGRSFIKPGYGLGVKYSREEGDHIVLGGVTLTLPVFSNGQELRAVGAARAARLRAERDGARTRVHTEVRAAFEAYRRRLAAVGVLEADAIPGLDENETLTTRSFEVGQLGMPELLLIRREILDTRSQYLDALLEAALARIDLDASAAILR